MVQHTDDTEADAHVPWSARDLQWVIATALARGSTLLSEHEHTVVQGLLALPDPALEVYARRSARRHAIQRAIQSADSRVVGPLLEAGMLSRDLDALERLTPLTVAELKVLARSLGLRRTGRRDALLERVSEHIQQSPLAEDAPLPDLVRVEHRALVRRLERFAFLRPWPDRSTLVVERLGHVRWVDYARTSGSGLFADRDALLRWEALLEPLPAEDRLDALEAGHHVGPGRLDLGRSLVRAVLHEARALERHAIAAPPDLAPALLERTQALYRRVHDVATKHPHLARYATRAAVRRSRTIEHTGCPETALNVLLEHRPHARNAGRLALNRAGRRLTRSIRGRHLGTGWVPDPPLAPVRERHLKLERVDPSASTTAALRPRWSDGERDHVVENAVVAVLAEQGRTAIHAEGGLWRTLFTLLLAPDCLFLPIPGQLPVARLSAPLDFGTPAFADRRTDAIETVRATIDAGQASSLIQRAYRSFEGCRLSGCHWSDVDTHVQLVDALPPTLLRTVFDTFLEEGLRAASGMPDLLVLLGPVARLPRGIPGRVGPGVHLAEIKGPTDTLSDAQRVWLHRLSRGGGCGARVEVWHVTALP